MKAKSSLELRRNLAGDQARRGQTASVPGRPARLGGGDVDRGDEPLVHRLDGERERLQGQRAEQGVAPGLAEDAAP